MTLDTVVAIGGGAINVREVFDLCRVMVNTPPGVEPRTDWSTGSGPGIKHLSNPGGIGADAWLITYYGADGPVPPHSCTDDCYLDDPEHVEAGESRCMDARSRDEGDPRYSGWASMVISFDTAYGHRGPDGEGCAELHRKYIEVLHDHVTRKGLQIKWQNEFTGEWFDGLAGLDELAKGGADAHDWFSRAVLPALNALTRTPGGES